MDEVTRLLISLVLLYCVHYVDPYERTEIVNIPGMGEIPSNLHDSKHGVKMGVSNKMCDNGKNNLFVDYDGSPREFKCSAKTREKMKRRRRKYRLKPPRMITHSLDPDYRPHHHCMYERIIYDTRIPTYEGHRPLWPVYGEYKYLPPQRWLHNVEHGATVMLYHPCTPKREVAKLRRLVENCVWKHAITPYRYLTLDRPLALVAWGASYEMSTARTDDVVRFIKRHALKGPEGTLSRDGQYKYMLLRKSEIPRGSDGKDSKICAFYDRRE